MLTVEIQKSEGQIILTDTSLWGSLGLPARNTVDLFFNVTNTETGEAVNVGSYNPSTVGFVVLTLPDGKYKVELKAGENSDTYEFLVIFGIEKCRDRIKDNLLDRACSDLNAKSDKDFIDWFKLQSLVDAMVFFEGIGRMDKASCIFDSARGICGSNKCCKKC